MGRSRKPLCFYRHRGFESLSLLQLTQVGRRRMNKFNIEDLYEKPYTNIYFPIHRVQIEKAMEAFFEFLKLPLEKKQTIDLKISPKHRRGELGFVHRNPEDHFYNDNKDFFHYHPVIEKQYAEFIRQNPEVENFLKKAAPIWEAVYQTIKAILSLFEPDYPGTLSKIFDSPTPHILLRFLRYEYASSGLYLAKPHFDSGSFTLAIAESSPGLRIGTHPDDLELMTHKEGHAIFMISSNFKKIIDNDILKPGWHDVIQVDQSKRDQPFSRWALVAFIDGHSVESLSRHETHKFYNSVN